MPSVGNQHGRLSLGAIDGAEAPHSQDFVLPRLRIQAIVRQRESAIVAAETDADQPLMLDPRAQAQRTEIPQVHASLGKRGMELRDERLIFRADRTDRPRRAIFKFQIRNIWQGYGRIVARGNCPGCTVESCTTTRASSATNCSGVASSGLMSISLIHGCSITNWLNRTSRASRTGRFTGLRPRTPSSAE